MDIMAWGKWGLWAWGVVVPGWVASTLRNMLATMLSKKKNHYSPAGESESVRILLPSGFLCEGWVGVGWYGEDVFFFLYSPFTKSFIRALQPCIYCSISIDALSSIICQCYGKFLIRDQQDKNCSTCQDINVEIFYCTRGVEAE